MKDLAWKIWPTKKRWLWVISMPTSKIKNLYSQSTRVKIYCIIKMKIKRIQKTLCLFKKKNLRPNPQMLKWHRRRKNTKRHVKHKKCWQNSLMNWQLLLPCPRKKNSLRREKLHRCKNSNSNHHPHPMRRNLHMEDTWKTKVSSTFFLITLTRKKKRIKK